jgi:hypothetical protein
MSCRDASMQAIRGTDPRLRGARFRGAWGGVPRGALAACAAWLLSLAGCYHPASEAADEFSMRFYCPADRVVVRPRPDIQPHTVPLVLTSVRRMPPPEVQADPDRLAMWNNRLSKHDTEVDSTYDIFQVDGCDRKVLEACRVRSHGSQAVCYIATPQL